MSSIIAAPPGLNLTIPDVPTFAPVTFTGGATEGTDLNDEGETVLGTVGPSSPLELAANSFAFPLVVSAPPASTQQTAFPNLFGYAVLILIAGVIAYAAYMLYEYRGKLEAKL